MRRSSAGRHGTGGGAPELIVRSMVPVTRIVRQSVPQIVHNTIRQTVVHLHQTTNRYRLDRSAPAGDGRTELIVRQAPAQPLPDERFDPSRPTLIANRLLRILSTDSAQKVLQPFFHRIVQNFLEQEREVRQAGPPQAPPPAVYGLSSAEFQSLVRSVTDAIRRQDRLDALRRGGDA